MCMFSALWLMLAEKAETEAEAEIASGVGDRLGALAATRWRSISSIFAL